MSAILSILALAVLFAGFGLLARGREQRYTCGGCGHRGADCHCEFTSVESKHDRT